MITILEGFVVNDVPSVSSSFKPFRDQDLLDAIRIALEQDCTRPAREEMAILMFVSCMRGISSGFRSCWVHRPSLGAECGQGG